jgi:hypothetical protein
MTNIPKFKFAVYSQMFNEEKLINTWIEHYINLGFEHLYIVDDNSSTKISDLLTNNPYKNQITIYDVDFTGEDYLNKNITHSKFYNSEFLNHNKQIYLLNVICNSIKNDIEWLFICDADEFLFIKDYDTIQEYMQYALITNPNVSEIYFNWVMYSTSYNSYFPEKGHLFDNFSYSDINTHVYGKSIIKTSDCAFFDVHASYLKKNNFGCIPFIDNNFKLFTSSEIVSTTQNTELVQNFNNVNAFCAHFITLDLYTFYNRRFIRKDIATNKPREQNFLCDFFLTQEQVFNCSLMKYTKNYKNPQNYQYKIIDIKKYNLSNNTNFSLIFDLLTHFYYNKTEIYYTNIDNILPDDFDVLVYKSLNTDLIHLTESQAKLHYLTNGIEEKRIYKLYNILPDDFA